MQPIVTLGGHEGKIMDADMICQDGNEGVITVSYDRTVKIWTPTCKDIDGDGMDI